MRTALLYVLLRRVNRELALMAMFFNLVSIGIEGSTASHCCYHRDSQANSSPTILIRSLIAELSLALWLLVKGVSAEQWDQCGHGNQSAIMPAAAATCGVGAA